MMASCNNSDASSDYEVVATFPHDPAAYTQGLVTANGTVYESLGRYGTSEVRRVQYQTGAVEERRPLDRSRFGEGLAYHDGRLIQLTWKEGVAYVYHLQGLVPVDSFKYAGEGWGLASDGTNLFMSDGSDSIRVLNPQTFAVERTFKVSHDGLPLNQLNELEFFDGMLLANVYQSDRIAIIHPQNGTVTRLLDFARLYRDRTANADVMNGITVAPDGVHLLVTGKYWPNLFQVRIKPPS